jgi:hypothetical protein
MVARAFLMQNAKLMVCNAELQMKTNTHIAYKLDKNKDV